MISTLVLLTTISAPPDSLNHLYGSTVKVTSTVHNAHQLGSGAIITSTPNYCLVLTVAHNIYCQSFKHSASSITISQGTRGYFRNASVSVVDASPALDLALLRVNVPSGYFLPLASASPPVNSTIHACGCPQGKNPRRLIPNARVLRVNQRYEGRPVFHFTGGSIQGQSGGPITNSANQLVGLVEFVIPRENVGGAVDLRTPQCQAFISRALAKSGFQAPPLSSTPFQQPRSRSPLSPRAQQQVPIGDSFGGRFPSPRSGNLPPPSL